MKYRMIRQSILGVALLAVAGGGTMETKAQVVSYPLPDPLVMNNGTPVTTVEQWQNQRRPELLILLENHMFGDTPVGRPGSLSFVVREEKPDARGGRATRLRVGILFEGTEEGRQMELLVYLPNDVYGPVPIFLGLNFDGNFTTTTEADIPQPTHYVNGLFRSVPNHKPAAWMRGDDARMWPYDTILDRGYGIATVCYGDIQPDMNEQWWHGPRIFSPPTADDDWGSIGAWAWALSRAMDWIETEPRIDSSKVAILGFSRLGKTVMWAGAQDERFAAVVSQCSGKGGISLMKRIVGEDVAHLTNETIGHWFADKFKEYAGNEEALPVDGHFLASLIAPRGLLILSGRDDSYSDPEGEFLSGVAATPVYELFGSEGLATTNWPSSGTLINSPVGYYMHSGGHDVTTDDWAATLNWADAQLNPFDGHYRVKVASDYGNPSPEVGVNSFPAGTVVTCSVPSSVTIGKTNYTCTGWSGNGDIPASGFSNSTGPITLTQDSSITWSWEVGGVRLSLLVIGGGSVSVSSGWYPPGTDLSLEAIPDPGWLFVKWSGALDGDYTTASTNLVMDAPKTLVAGFSQDADEDGILNVDEEAFGTSPRKTDTDGDQIDDFDEIYTYHTDPAGLDSDGDGVGDGKELLVYGTNPTIADSDMDGFSDGFEVSTGFDPTLDSSTPDLFSVIKSAVELQFYSTTNMSYRIEATDSLSNPWEIIEADIMNEGPIVSRLYSVEGQSNRFFRVRHN